ncbi:MAG TPA: hypothetical protein VKA84_15770 [Gemmatimonadaceae bacterium]|nr:hypothetical protein [Gemmatimonadaceae bacterium]
MRKSAITAAVAVAVLATTLGIYHVSARTASARPAATLTPELSKDLDLASAAGVEYAPALQTVSAVERSPSGKSTATAAPRRPKPKADPAPRKVEVGDETGVAVAPDPEETQDVPVANGTAEPEPEPTEEPAPVITQRPVPIPVGYPGRDGNGGGGYGGMGRGGMGGGIGGVLIGVVIRGGAVGDDHCDPHPRRNRGRVATVPRIPTQYPEGTRGRGTFLR